DETDAKRPTVQVGDPFTEKLLLEACLELMQTDAIVAIQDMGAAGLTSSSFEMASRGKVGIEMDLDKVPIRETGMTPYEIMLSESQERMLLVLREGAEDKARNIMAKWDLDFATVGAVTASGSMVLRWHGDVVADVPIDPVSGASPVYQRPFQRKELAPPVVAESVSPPVPHDQALLKLIGSPDLCSKRWIFEQYDHMVMADTVQRPGGDAAVVRIHGTERALALTIDCTPRYCYADPVQGGRQAVAEAWRNLTAVGARPLGVTDCLNFGNPENPEIMGQFVGCLEGVGEACQTLDFPIVSGNVSLYNETDGQAILPTPTIGGVGLLDDLANAVTMAYDREGLPLVLVGETHGWLGCSLYLREICGREEGAPPPVDPSIERRNGDLVRRLIAEGEAFACHDLADGGLSVALAEMAMASGIGAALDLPADGVDAVGWLFGEDQGRYLLAIDPENLEIVLEKAKTAEVVARVIGKTDGRTLTLKGCDAICLSELAKRHESWLPG
ncbi:MAG: phosphoribosylformylglycinamidine synthase subunit PurL, partial [Alphaproteobacteria bacterium]|nr:phosphoribosylformylglycinamidine synthase subunit PurL [Alphaproteobacteria bacterium]